MKFYPGFDITPTTNPLGFVYGDGVFGPIVENRKLSDIRKSLLEPECSGPEIVYSIAMDVGKREHKELLKKMMLLFGVVTYAAGKLGKEPVRSQGHIHKTSAHSGWSPPEIYEIWNGSAIIYMQEFVLDNPGRCFAVVANEGDVVIVPPYWAHATISANPNIPLTFGAWCDREYGFLYDEVRAKKGLTFYPILKDDLSLEWKQNTNYQASKLIIKKPRIYREFQIEPGIPIYRQFEMNPQKFQFVSIPELAKKEWESFIP